MAIVFEIAALGILIGIAAIHASRFRRNIPTSDWFHAIWTTIYFIPCIVICFLWGSWWLAAAFIFERAVFFSPILNLMRGDKAFFYTGNSVTGSWFDKFLGKSVPYFWAASLIIFVLIQFKL